MPDAENTVRGLLADLDAASEHERLEAKLANEVGKSVLETICAFANTSGMGGGDLLPGVDRGEDEDGGPVYAVAGVKNPERLSEQMATRSAGQFNRVLRPRVTTVVIDGKLVVHAFVPEADPRDKPVYVKKLGQSKGAFLRVGATDVAATLPTRSLAPSASLCGQVPARGVGGRQKASPSATAHDSRIPSPCGSLGHAIARRTADLGRRGSGDQIGRILALDAPSLISGPRRIERTFARSGGRARRPRQTRRRNRPRRATPIAFFSVSLPPRGGTSDPLRPVHERMRG